MLDAMDEDVDDEDDAKVARNFNAELYTKHFESIFEDLYDLNIKTWAKASTADNCATNSKLARLLGLPHVPCSNHLLNPDVKKWVKEDKALKNLIENIVRTMKQAKTQKNTAALSAETHLKLVLHNETRWSGIRSMLACFVRIRDQLIDVAETDGCELEVEESGLFVRRCKKYLLHKEQFDTVTKLLQTRLQPLNEARDLLEDIIKENEASHKRRLATRSVLKDCTFVPKRIRLQYEKLHKNAAFESGVCKIQDVKELTLDEAAACESLLLVNMANINDIENNANLDKLQGQDMKEGRGKRPNKELQHRMKT